MLLYCNGVILVSLRFYYRLYSYLLFSVFNLILVKHWVILFYSILCFSYVYSFFRNVCFNFSIFCFCQLYQIYCFKYFYIVSLLIISVLVFCCACHFYIFLTSIWHFINFYFNFSFSFIYFIITVKLKKNKAARCKISLIFCFVIFYLISNCFYLLLFVKAFITRIFSIGKGIHICL